VGYRHGRRAPIHRLVAIHVPKSLLVALALLVAAGVGALALRLLGGDTSTVTASRAATSARVSAVRLLGDCRHLQTRPANVVFACADHGLLAQHVRWRD
jgi:hypothetical protein